MEKHYKAFVGIQHDAPQYHGIVGQAFKPTVLNPYQVSPQFTEAYHY